MRTTGCTKGRPHRRTNHWCRARAAILVLGLLFMAPAAAGSESPWEIAPGELGPPEPSTSGTLRPGAPGTQSYPLSGDCALHPGIRISEDEGATGFEWTNPTTGSREPRPGSGVTRGSGTQEDPYVIEGWCIGPAGIHVSDTRSSLIIRDNRITGTGVDADAVGIRIENASDVTLSSNQVKSSGHGIGVWSSQRVTIDENLLLDNLRHGAWVAQSQHVTIRDNEARSNENGLGIAVTHGALVTSNVAELNTQAGILNAFSDEALIQGNTLAANDIGVYIREAFDVAVVDNTMDDHAGNGIAFDLSPRGLAERNRVAGSGNEGIIFWSSPNGKALENQVTDTGFEGDRYGLRMAGSPNSTVLDNIADQNAHGIVLDGSPGSVAERNLISGNEGDGLILWESPQARVAHNALTENTVGIRVVGAVTDLQIESNNVFANALGLDAEKADATVDATGNWWGCPRGPGEPGCDAATGAADTSDWLRQADPDAPEPGLGGPPGQGRGQISLS